MCEIHFLIDVFYRAHGEERDSGKALACEIDMNKQALVGFISALLKILVK